MQQEKTDIKSMNLEELKSYMDDVYFYNIKIK